MPIVNTAERIKNLSKARAAAVAVRDEIDRLDSDPAALSSRIVQRRPTRQRADNQIGKIDLELISLAATGVSITLDPAMVADLDKLARKLDGAIVAGALLDIGLTTLKSVLDTAAHLRDIVS